MIGNRAEQDSGDKESTAHVIQITLVAIPFMFVRRAYRARVVERILSLNFSSNSSRYGFNQQLENIEAAEVARRESFGGVQNISSTGVRALELCTPETGNYLDLNVLNNLTSMLTSLETNWTANAVFIGSRSNDFFSLGIHEDDAEEEGGELFRRVQSITVQVNDYADKKLLALYGGYITGTPFGMLLGAEVSKPLLNNTSLTPRGICAVSSGDSFSQSGRARAESRTDPPGRLHSQNVSALSAWTGGE